MLQFTARKLDGYGLIIPGVLKSLRCHRRIGHGMLNVLVPRIILNGSDSDFAENEYWRGDAGIS
jgi:hypothetical protein